MQQRHFFTRIVNGKFHHESKLTGMADQTFLVKKKIHWHLERFLYNTCNTFYKTTQMGDWE